MQQASAVARLSILLSSVCGLASLWPQSRPAETPCAEVAPVWRVVTGRVLLPNGAPAGGAKVVTSAGGQAITGTDGSFTLAVHLAADARTLEVTATLEGLGAGDLVASARLVPAALAPNASVGQLVLSPPFTCHPRWLPTFDGPTGVDGHVGALAVFDDGTGPALYVGGSFDHVGGTQVNGLAKWDGSNWTPVGSGVGGLADTSVEALLVYDDGSGPALYVAGYFLSAGGAPASRIARWDGANWSPLGSGMTGASSHTVVAALAVYDDGSGPALVAGGNFLTAGGTAARCVARWDGANWSPLGAGVTDADQQYPGVMALAVYDDGSGPALFAAGQFFTAGTIAVNHIAKWDGSTWSAVAGGMDAPVHALSVFDDGSGPALYAGGNFSFSGGSFAKRVAKWDGSGWSEVGGGIGGAVLALAVHDDSHGPALYAAGAFGRKVAKLDGSSWTGLANEMDNPPWALASWDDGDGPGLFVGGDFTVGPSHDRYLAKFGCRPKPTFRER